MLFVLPCSVTFMMCSICCTHPPTPSTHTHTHTPPTHTLHTHTHTPHPHTPSTHTHTHTHTHTGSAEREYVLDVAPPPLTLAQSLGLVEAPQQLLSCAEWEGVRVCSNKRQDSRLPCPICQEDFGLSQQVLN